MGNVSKPIDYYLQKIPEPFRSNVSLMEDYQGNRTKISFNFSCGCQIQEQFKAFLKRSRFDFCASCAKKNSQTYSCQYCCQEFTVQRHLENCQQKCQNKYAQLILGTDYVICQICNLHARSLGAHVTKKHNMSHKEYREKYGSLICTEASKNYKESGQYNREWITRAHLNGTDLTEYKNKLSTAVKEAIMSNPEERKRRSELMATINKTENMRIKSSKSAKITSAKPEILEKRTKQLQKWREENPDLFYNQCTAPMIKSFQSKPERILFNYFSQLNPFNFKRNQFIKSKYFTNSSKKKQVDIIDLDNRIYIEFDGKVHFKPIFGDSVLLKTKLRDQELEKVITSNNWILIRISYDQFVYTTKNINKIKHDASYFKPESLQQIEAILKSKQPGVYKIGEAYNSSKS